MRSRSVNETSNPLLNTPHHIAGALADVPTTRPIPDLPDIEPTSRFGSLFSGELVNLLLWLNDESIAVSFVHHVILGRAHNGFTPPNFVDLTPFKALQYGVSRRHIEITREGTLLYVEDLSSTNGSLLNGQPLTPGQPRILRDGDRLHLAHLPIDVQFQQLRDNG